MFAAMLAAAVTFAACSSDDDGKSSFDDSALVGAWVEDSDDIDELFCFELYSNHTGYEGVMRYGVVDEQGKETFTWSSTETTITTVLSDGSGETVYYSLNGDNLRISASLGGGEAIYYVRK